MRRRPRRYRRSVHTRRKRHNWMPLIVFVLVLGFFLWALFQFFSLLFANVRTEISSAQLEILQGRGEFRLSNDDSEWTPAFSGQNFVEGDQLQTARNAHLELTFFEDHHLFLGEDSHIELVKLEKKSSGQFTAYWRLNRGQLWARIDNTAWAQTDEKPDIKIYTPRSIVNVTGTTFNINVTEESDELKLIQGGVQLDLLDAEDEVENRVTVSVGQQIAVSDNASSMAEPASLLEIIEPEFLESEWHLRNLEQFDPEGVAATRKKIDARNAPAPTPELPVSPDLESTAPLNPDLEAPIILSPAQNAVIPAAQNSITLEGTAPEQAFQIQINGYTLSKFEPGDRKWTYFAATQFNTLNPGENLYQIIAIDRQGQRSPVTELRLTYEGVAPAPAPTPAPVEPAVTEEAPAEGTSAPVTETEETTEVSIDFPAPRVTTPTLFADDPNATYQTSSDRVTLFGEVPVGTNSVRVNGFQLQKFSVGDTKFQYTAIALGANGNMQEGENTYTIQAIGPDGLSSEAQVKVVYTPLNIEN